jgi:RNA polymerase sigma-70 factor (ECF subfamily)
VEDPHSEVIRQWIAAARGGSREALGQALEHCRQYLLLMANEELDGHLRAKIGASDLVQETFLKAQGHFDGFHGETEGELLQWLRRILLNHLANTNRQFQGTEKRALGREVPIEELPFATVPDAGGITQESPSKNAAANERADALRAALAQLPEHYQQVIQLRNYDRLSFEEIGQKTGRTAEAVRKLWARGLKQLEEILERSESK